MDRRASSPLSSVVQSEDDLSSSDPDDYDATLEKSLDPDVKAKLCRYMVKIRERERELLAKFEKRRQEQLEEFDLKLAGSYGSKLAREVKKARSKRKKRKRTRSEEVPGMLAKRPRREEYPAPSFEAVPLPAPYFEETPQMREQRLLLDIEASRRALWVEIATQHIPEAHSKMQVFAYILRQNSAKIASMARQSTARAKQSRAQLNKDLVLRTKRAAREMLLFWKRNEREERDLRKRAEKEKLELLKREEEARESQRQARKLNFLITQTELYSHFVGKKLDGGGKEIADDAASDVVPISSFDEIDFDEEDDDHLKARAAHEAQAALAKQLAAARAYDTVPHKPHKMSSTNDIQMSEATVDQMDFMNPSSLKADSEVEQPRMLTVTLKSYQLKGLNWLAGLWEQGINGILADEMGLGKTIQSISLMGHLAESHSIWGPFLVVSPASTLPNWQQEIARFTPQLKVLPYWGDPDDRKTLRGFLTSKNLGNRDSPFHVAITSYQLIVSDYQQFNRIKWQYMILDEAQAIKSSSSIRWKTLLKLPSRNRLLLTGTPIQNSMQELWSLLHFIMPTLFDSHEEFSEWFSKDIESHVEAGGEGKGLNEEQLRRLHMILKPFMLRRIKRDVENELAEKIELELPCPLTWRQRELYRRLKSKISVRELLDGMSSSSSTTNNAAAGGTDLWGDEEGGDTLMNLVMQFRKVCNHPELFERGMVKGPLYGLPVYAMGEYAGARTSLVAPGWSMLQFRIPRLVAHFAWEASRSKWKGLRVLNSSRIRDASEDSDSYSFLPFTGNSVGAFAYLSNVDILARWVHHLLVRDALHRLREYRFRNDMPSPADQLFLIVDPSRTADITGLPDVWALEWCLHQATILPRLETAYLPSANAGPVQAFASSRHFEVTQHNLARDNRVCALLNNVIPAGLSPSRPDLEARELVSRQPHGWEGLAGVPSRPRAGWSFFAVPSVERLVTDSGKMLVLDRLLIKLKAEGHRVLIFFQMTLMMDLMEEYLANRQYNYLRLDGSTSIFDRRDLVNDWQSKPELFVFMLSTRAGGLGINLTAADTVIFYDSDWNPTVDQQAMDRSHRLGQTKQVTVYRLITTGTIEDRILQRARQKDQIQKVVISGGEFKQQVEFKPKEVLSLLLDDEEMEEKVRKEAQIRQAEEEEKERQKAAKAIDKTTKRQTAAATAKTARKAGHTTAAAAGAGGTPVDASDTASATPAPVKRVRKPRKPKQSVRDMQSGASPAAAAATGGTTSANATPLASKEGTPAD
ncbi:putative DNA helicase ino80 [Thoreauomyces humboldtii]|nr:putative DNA helicase ino80 [Thoreauomyces humboldtii]